MDIFFILPVLVLIGLAAGAVFMFVQGVRGDGAGMTMERAMAQVMGKGSAAPPQAQKAESEKQPQSAASGTSDKGPDAEKTG